MSIASTSSLRKKTINIVVLNKRVTLFTSLSHSQVQLYVLAGGRVLYIYLDEPSLFKITAHSSCFYSQFGSSAEPAVAL